MQDPKQNGWTLTLGLSSPGRLLALLSDGKWGCEVAHGVWPPTASTALPGEIVRALARVEGAPLRLQLQSILDTWSWEREIEGIATGMLAVPRYLTDLPEHPTQVASFAGVVAAGASIDDHLSLVQGAQHQQRPLVVVDPLLPAERRRALDRSLRRHWRDPLLLSEALPRVLAQVGLPPACCRLYGDGLSTLVDAEQGWRPATALSIDVVSSTRLLQSVGAEAYARQLQAYHERCRAVVLSLEGSLDTPQGDDGLMAYFGFPLALEDAATRALAAAWQLSCGMSEIGLQVRIGVASGRVAVSGHQAFAPEVHLAARLRDAASPGQILVAASTVQRVGRGFRLEPCDESLRLKDFDRTGPVHRLLGLQPGASVGRSRPRATSGFIGRRRELQALREAWAAACSGRVEWCVVRGEAGIGKSRLLQEFLSELRAQGQRCLELAGQVQSSNSPFAAVVDSLRQYWAIDPEVEAARLQQRLVGFLRPQDRESADVADLARLLAMSAPDEARHGATGHRRWSDLLLECLETLVATGPFCLLVDDAHWLDPSTIELLRKLREVCGGHALLVLWGERSESGRTALVGAAPMELQGLSDAEARELAGQLGATLPERVRQRIVDRAEGVPLYLEESLRVLSHRDGEEDGDVPATLQDLLMVRLDELGPDRALAQLLRFWDASAAQLIWKRCSHRMTLSWRERGNRGISNR